MIKKIIVTLLLCIPLVASAQMKPGVPISDVVREAQSEMGLHKQSKSTSKQINIRTKKQKKPKTGTTYNPDNVVGVGPVIDQGPRTVRTSRNPRGQRQSTQQQDTPQGLTIYNQHLVTGVEPVVNHEFNTSRNPRRQRQSTQQQSTSQSITTYNQYLVTGVEPVVNHEFSTSPPPQHNQHNPHNPRNPRGQRQSTQQQNTPQGTTTYNQHLVTGAGPATYHESRTAREQRKAAERNAAIEQRNFQEQLKAREQNAAREQRRAIEQSKAMEQSAVIEQRKIQGQFKEIEQNAVREQRKVHAILAANTPHTAPEGFNNQLNYKRKFGLSLSTNTLMWALATPNLDLRLQCGKFSLIGSVAYAEWSMPEHKFWWIRSANGELRYDITPNVYVGAMYNWFNYNIKFDGTGNQGLATAAGIVVGYKLPIGRKLSLDFGLGLGYALVTNEKYHNEGTVFIRDELRTYGYWGLTKAQISLVWRIF